jgi:hypothetical protein
MAISGAVQLVWSAGAQVLLAPMLTRRRALEIAGWSAAVGLTALPLLLTGGRTAGYDWDWFFAHYEALRRVIVVHHQFPWWNPWSAGGAPLFADPQVGLISLQTPLVLAFGTAVGLKLGYVAHLLAGFWGMYLLLGQLGAGHWRRVLLAGAWIGCTFVQFHFLTGHYTFLQYLLVPFVFHAFLRGIDERRWRLIAALSLAVFVNASPHNVAIQALVLLMALAAYRLYRATNRRQYLLDQGWLVVMVAVLCLPRLLFALEYLRDYPRPELVQPVTTFAQLARAFLVPGQRFSDWQPGGMPNWELSAYLGLGLVVLLPILLVRAIVHRREEGRFLALFALTIATTVIAMGPFASVSPYALMLKVPVLKALQVPSRWFGWTLFLLVLAIGSVRRWPRWGCVLVAAALVEVHAANLLARTPFDRPPQPLVAASFDQYDDYPRPPGRGTAMFAAMQHGYGEVRAYEPMLGYDQYHRPTRRCGINHGCGMITGNGVLSRWSPNQIEVRRQGPGPIFLNINPGKYWVVAGRPYPGSPRVAEPSWPFVLDDAGPVIRAQVRPSRSYLLLLPLLSLALLPLLRFTGDRRSATTHQAAG